MKNEKMRIITKLFFLLFVMTKGITLCSAQSTPLKVAYYAFDHKGPKLSAFSPDANVVILFEGHVWMYVDSLKYPFAQQSYLTANGNYNSYKSIINDVRVLQARGVKVLINVDDASSWQTATPFSAWGTTPYTTSQYVDMIGHYTIDSLKLDGIALDVEHIQPYSTVPTQNYLNILTGLGQYFGPMSSHPNSIYTIATGSDVYYGINPIQTMPAYAANLNFVMDMCYWNTNAQRISTRLPPYANAANIGWPKTMAGTDTENGLTSTYFTQDILSAQWQPAGSYKAGIMVYAGNGDTAYTGQVFRALSNPSVASKPVVDFTGSPVSITTGQSVTFTNNTSGATSYSWTFTGGTPSTATVANPVVTYNTAGSYTVKLVATNASGSDSLTRTGYINVSSPGTPGNYSLTFNGTNQSVNAGTINLSGSAVSMEAWVKAAAFKTTSPYISTIMGTEVGATNTALLRFGDGNIPAGNKLQFVISNGSTQIKLTSKTVFNTNSWYHVAATFDGTAMKMYVNGTLDTSSSVTAVLTSNGVYNLGYSWDNTRYFNGQLDELKVWKRALTQSEVQSGMCGVNPASASLEAYWKLNDGGMIAGDTTGHVHTGTLVNMTTTNWNSNVTSTCGTPLPVAGFTGTPLSITAGQSVTFTNNSTNASTYNWTFSGGSPSTSTVASPVITYNTAGTYTAKLIVTNSAGSDSMIRTNYITVTNPAAANKSVLLNGTNQYLNAGTINLSGAALSIEGWVKPAAFKTTSPYISTVMGMEVSGGTALLRFGDVGVPNNKLQFVVTIGTGQKKLLSATSFNTNTWYHIAATYDGATMKIYVNGILDTSVAQTGSVTANGVFYIGNSYTDNLRYWNGNLDELRVWKKALTQAEIQSNMCTVPVNSTSLEAYWKLNDGTGLSAKDTTGHLHNAAFVNMTTANWSTDVSGTCGTTARRMSVSGITSSTVYSKDNFIAWPNPVSKGNYLNITVMDMRFKSELTIYSLTGNVVYKKYINSKISRIPTAGLSSGMYYFSIRSEKGMLLDKGSFIVR